MFNLISVFLPIILGFILLASNIKDRKTIHKFSFFITTFTLISVLINNIFFKDTSIDFLKLVLNIQYSFKTDGLAIFFSTIIVIIWLLASVYAFSYMSHSKNEKRFFSFFLISLGALLGVVYANNLATLYSFFEGLSLAAYVLVIHDGTNSALLAGRKFIYYSIFGASLGLIATIYLYSLVSDPTFIAGGIPEIAGFLDRDGIILITFLAVVGFGCKAGLYPLHSWLSAAHPIAPAPASGVLSGLITKAGVVAIIRVIYYFVGPDLLKGTWVQTALILLSLLTIFMGSMLAVRDTIIKKRLAYSSVSQVSYVLLGVFLLNDAGFTGALLQVVFHASAKTLLFLVAGAIIFKTHHTKIDEIIGLGNKYKSIFIFLLIGGLSLVGIPLTGGFVSKWYLAQGALSSSIGVFAVLIIMLSALLTAVYLFSPVANAFFVPNDKMIKGKESLDKLMFTPMIILSLIIIVLGTYPKPIIDFILSITATFNL